MDLLCISHFYVSNHQVHFGKSCDIYIIFYNFCVHEYIKFY